jgi:hypothetical protein
MAFTVEDGTGLANASSYVSVEEADEYFGDRQNFDWEAGDKESALIRATFYIDGKYSGLWSGTRTNGRDQALSWPRYGALDSEGNEIPEDEIPVELKYAVMEAALREMAIPGSLSPDQIETQTVVREKVGPLEVEYDSKTGVDNPRPMITVIDELLKPLLGRRSSNVGFLLRA